MNICIYGSASNDIDRNYIERTEEFAKTLAKRGHSLVFGGGANGLMGAAARGFFSQNAKIVGVVPKFFNVDGILFSDCDEMIRTDTMRQRKQIMDDMADAFITTPGGIGTYEEFFEILTLKQLCRHNKPIAIYNINGYYDSLHEVMKQAIGKNFIKENCLELYRITDNLCDIIAYIEDENRNIRTVKELKDG